MDILRGHALTNPNGLVVDVFQFTDGERFLELNASAQEVMFRTLNDVVVGSADVAERLRGREQRLFHRRESRGQAGRLLRQPRIAPLYDRRNRRR